MSGMNLSQSAQQRKENEGRKGVGQGLLFLVAVIVIVAGIWGGLLFYENSLAADVVDMGARIQQEQTGMSLDKIDSVTDFQFRIQDIAADKGKNPVELTDLFGAVEGAVLPGVTLSKYSYDAEAKTVELGGEADSLRTVVQQVAVLKKKMPGLGTFSVPKIERNGSGRISFSFSLSLGQ